MKQYDDLTFRHLPEELDALFRAAGAKSFFNLAAWYDVVAQYGLPSGAHTRLFIDDSASVGLLTCRFGPTQTLISCSTPYTCEHAVLENRPEPEAVRRLVAATARSEALAPGFHFSGIDPADPAFAAIMAGLRDVHCVVRPYFAWGTWYEDVTDCDFAAYLARRPSALRNTWRRKSSALKKNAIAALRMYTPGDDIESFISAYEDVYAKSWKSPEPFTRFIPALIRVAAELGALRFGILDANGQPIAAQFWLVWNGQATIFKLANDETWNLYSPGTLLTMHIAQRVLEEGHINEINFGRGDDGYKKLWLSQRRERWGIEAANPRTALGGLRAMRIMASQFRDRIVRSRR